MADVRQLAGKARLRFASDFKASGYGYIRFCTSQTSRETFYLLGSWQRKASNAGLARTELYYGYDNEKVSKVARKV